MASKRNKQLSKREYDKIKHTAWEYIVVNGFEQKQVAELLGISTVTISKWSNNDPAGNWRSQREVRMQNQSTETDNIRKLIQVLSKQRLELESSISQAIAEGDDNLEIKLRKQANSLSDEMSKQNKVLLNLDKTSYTLGVFIDVMDEIFNSLRLHNQELWEKTIEFQSNLIRRKTQELG